MTAVCLTGATGWTGCCSTGSEPSGFPRLTTVDQLPSALGDRHSLSKGSRHEFGAMS